MSNIPTNMLRLFKVRMSDGVLANLEPVLKSGYIGEGPKVKEFEKALEDRWIAERFHQPMPDQFVVTTNSATSAEHLAFHMLRLQGRIKDGEEVLTTPLTCTATNWPIVANNLKIKWVDVDSRTLNMDLDDLARKITPSTKAIMLVHWGGYPIDMDKVNAICDSCEAKFGFRPAVVQDCAHAMGTLYKGKSLVSLSDFCTFSFQAIKHLTCGDGGALVVRTKEDYKMAKLLRWYGIDREGDRKDFRCEADIQNWGFKFHMNDIAATIGLSNLPTLDDTVRLHKNNAAYYNTSLVDTPGVTLLDHSPNFDSAYWIYTIRVERRDDFMSAMKSRGIEVSRVHERNDKHSCMIPYRALLPTLEVVASDMICIPVGWFISQEDCIHIVESIKKGW